jgi:hypothetical protein
VSNCHLSFVIAFGDEDEDLIWNDAKLENSLSSGLKSHPSCIGYRNFPSILKEHNFIMSNNSY